MPQPSASSQDHFPKILGRGKHLCISHSTVVDACVLSFMG